MGKGYLNFQGGGCITRVNSVLWAKKSDQDGSYRWLSLKDHLEDTRGIMGKLWDYWLSPGDKACIEDSLSEKGQGKKLAMFLAAIHDIGKATPEFQLKQGFTCSSDLDSLLVERLEYDGFTGLSDMRGFLRNYNPHALAGEAILDHYGVKSDIHSIIGGHHGKPLDSKSDYFNQYLKYPESYYQSDTMEDPTYQKWEKTHRGILDWALESSCFKSVEDLPRLKQKGEVILNGLLIMADWIASNEKYFPLVDLDEEGIDSKERLEEAWRTWSKGSLWEPKPIEDLPCFFEDRFDFIPRQTQEEFLDIIKKIANPGLFIFEAPMGMGKTEAALAGSEILAEKTGRSGLYFGLPTQATSNGIFPRIKDWLERIAKDTKSDQGLRLIHGKASLNKDFSQLPQSSQINIDGEEGKQATVVTNRWFSGRKTATLEDFVVATVDQCLLLALKQKHLALRHLGFSRKVVIIDELHSYDSYMNVYLDEALTWLATYNVPVILLSATLPAQTRKNLMFSYAKGLGYKKRDLEKNDKDLETFAYPLVTYNDDNRVKAEPLTYKGELKTVELIQKSKDEAISLMEDLFQHEGVIGVIFNTVKEAQKFARQCSERFGSENVDLLHSSFIAEDRVKKESKLLKEIGKNGIRPKKKIIIGTQVIEQSLDIDFDVLVTELAPIDLLIQRIGRLHRHLIPRDPAFSQARTYILGCSENLDFDKGSTYVYENFLLTRSQYFLPEKLVLPADISPLVQKVYGEEELILEASLESKYLEFKEEYKTTIREKEDKARVYRLADPISKTAKNSRHNLLGWLNFEANLDSEEMAYAQVRDSGETIEVLAVKKIGDGYGFIAGDEDISNSLDDDNLVMKLANQSLKLPQALCKIFNIEQTIEELEEKNRPLWPWQENHWLKGSLGLVFDENLEVYLSGYRLSYDEKYGLSYEEIERSENV